MEDIFRIEIGGQNHFHARNITQGEHQTVLLLGCDDQNRPADLHGKFAEERKSLLGLDGGRIVLQTDDGALLGLQREAAEESRAAHRFGQLLDKVGITARSECLVSPAQQRAANGPAAGAPRSLLLEELAGGPLDFTAVFGMRDGRTAVALLPDQRLVQETHLCRSLEQRGRQGDCPFLLAGGGEDIDVHALAEGSMVTYTAVPLGPGTGPLTANTPALGSQVMIGRCLSVS